MIESALGRGEVLGLLGDCVDYASLKRRSERLAMLEATCGARNVRLAVMQILWWLKGGPRKGGNSTPSSEFVVRAGDPRDGVACLLVERGFSAVFEFDGVRLFWRSCVREELRDEAARFVAESWTPRMME